MKRISVVGLGYIGLPTAIMAAQKGYQVFGFDVNDQKVEKINSGDPTIAEPEIMQRLYEVLNNKNFRANTQIQQADCFVIAVPTPFKENSEKDSIKKSDLSYVFSAADEILKVLGPGNLVILESTVPVGTTSKLADYLENKSGLKIGIDIFVAHCPERVLPGKIFEELVKNDRVIGGVCLSASYLAKDFYSKFVKGRMFFTDDKTAEMVKLVENSSRDVEIAFANQIAAMCYRTGIDPYKVIDIANKHPRVNILSPGCGVGGHCIAVDPWFLVEGFPQDSALLNVARQINDKKPIDIINETLKKVEFLNTLNIIKPKILALGVTFKPDVDDIRQSPALKIVHDLAKKTELLELAVCEPNLVSEKINDIGFEKVMGLLDGIKWADIILILVKHSEFLALKNLNLKDKVIIDTCGLIYQINEKDKELFFGGKFTATNDLGLGAI